MTSLKEADEDASLIISFLILQVISSPLCFFTYLTSESTLSTSLQFQLFIMAFRAAVFLVIAALSYSPVFGYSSGAPNDPGICKSMTPKHPGAPQNAASPYGLSVDKLSAKKGETVTLTISSTGPKIKGFLVQGRNSNSDENTTPVGKFIPDSDSKGLTCSDIPNSSLTHSNNNERESVAVQWVAPEQPGTYVILATVVQDGLTYWIRQKSQTITVS